jgi:hypothetical protein
LLLTALFICFHVVEHIAIGLFKGETLAASVPHIGGGGLAGLACVAVILFVTLIPFFAFKHVGRELGEGRLRAMLFGADISVLIRVCHSGSARSPIVIGPAARRHDAKQCCALYLSSRASLGAMIVRQPYGIASQLIRSLKGIRSLSSAR